MNAWIYLVGAIVLEIAGTTFLKLSDGFEKWQWGAGAIACYWLCFWLLAPALKVLPVGVVYAIWAGMGILGAAAIGVFFFREHLGLMQYGCITLILIGAVGLRLTTQTG